MKAWHYLITGVITYLFFLIINIPATIATGMINEHLPQATIKGTTGTVWKGSAQIISLASGEIINDANWSVCLWRLLTAEVCIDLDARYQDKPVQGQLGLGITGTIKARDLHAELDAQSLGALARLPIGELSGLVFIQLESVTWKDDEIPSATGIINWKSAAITIAETAELGDVTIDLTDSDEYSLAAIISNKGGHVVVNGESQVGNDGNYNLELQLTPNTSASKNLRPSLEMFAKQQKDGSFVLKNTGNLKQIGIM